MAVALPPTKDSLVRERFGEAAFAKFLNLGRCAKVENQSILNDFIFADGAIYLTELDTQIGKLH